MASKDGHAFQSSMGGNDACALTQARFEVEMDALAKVDSPDFHRRRTIHCHY